MFWLWFPFILLGVLLVIGLYDVCQRRHAILRNFPVIGHFRYILEAIGPELRQYIVTDNDEERPFSRDQRRWVYASSKRENNYFGFGTDNDLENSNNYLIIKHSAFPIASPLPGDALYDPLHLLPCAKVLGGWRNRPKAFRPMSVTYVSGMSFGALSGAAVEAINRGCKKAHCLQSTGEGGISKHHQQGGNLMWQIGTGYFGCRDAQGRFNMDQFRETLARNPTIQAIEIKMSQGAKPGLGGMLPAAKVTREVAQARGIPVGRDCISPPGHSAFNSVEGLIDFVEMLASESGLPVGIKSAVGEMEFWDKLTRRMATTKTGPDFVAIDGGEGGTGAAPLVFTDHVALPFKQAFHRVYLKFAEQHLTDHIVFIGSAKLGFPEASLLAFGLGCDMIAAAREPMMAIGCIQAQRCHTGHCPAGVATQNAWLVRGLDPTLKADRLANYMITWRMEIEKLCHAAGVVHPALITTDHVEILDRQFDSTTLSKVFGYRQEHGRPSKKDLEEITRIMNSPGKG